MRSQSASIYSLPVGALVTSCVIVAFCLLLAGCAKEEQAEPRRYGLTTGSIGSAATAHPNFVIVEPRDTLYRLARRHNVTVYDLMAANALRSTRISAGQRLAIPAY